VPALRQLAMLHIVKLARQLWMIFLVFFNPTKPGIAELLAASADAVAEMTVNRFGNQKFGVLRPAIVALGQPNLFLPQGLAMRSARVLLVRSPPGDMAINNNQSGPIGAFQKSS